VHGLGSVRGGGEFIVDRMGPDDTTWNELGRSDRADSAFRLGPERTAPATLWLLWGLELSQQGHEDPSVRARALLAWRSTVQVPNAPFVRPGDRLRARVTTRVGKQAESAEVLVRREAFIDVPLVNTN